MIRKIVIIAFLSISYSQSRGQNRNSARMMEQHTNTNPLICDTLSGSCGIADTAATTDKKEVNSSAGLRIIYFTDPICSSCWAIEPQLRKLKLEYGNSIDMEYHMGGLLRDWTYNSGGISKPSDVAHHWDEVSIHYDMPIDGDVWLEDPLPSSYPPSIAFKAAQTQSPEKAISFLRILREKVFLQKQNICKWQPIEAAAVEAELDPVQLKADYEGPARQLFEADLQLAKSMGVRGFPSLFLTTAHAEPEFIYGAKPYSVYESALSRMLPDIAKQSYDKSTAALFQKFPSLTAKEYAELATVPRSRAETVLDEWVAKGLLRKTQTKNGSIWMRAADYKKQE